VVPEVRRFREIGEQRREQALRGPAEPYQGRRAGGGQSGGGGAGAEVFVDGIQVNLVLLADAHSSYMTQVDPKLNRPLCHAYDLRGAQGTGKMLPSLGWVKTQE
jgi:hypothetical protein